jgi:O-acetylserine/cysteine efflux transporter
MSFIHLLLLLLVILIWGINFIFIKYSLVEVSPLLLCAIRFLLASIPGIFFIKLPKIPFKAVAGYGLFMFGLQFGFLFIGINTGMTPGIASLILQMQIFFSMLFAACFLGELPYIWQIAGALVSLSGIVIVASHLDNNISLSGFLCILVAAAAWGIGNLITKKYSTMNKMGLVVWGSFIASFPMLLASLLLEGLNNFSVSWQNISLRGIGSIFYIVYASTWVGYGVWNWLLSKYPVSVVVPFTLLVPIVGIVSSVLILNEPFQTWKFFAAMLVISGLGLSVFGTRFFGKKIQI